MLFVAVESMSFGSSDTKISLTCSGQEGNTTYRWDCKEVPRRATHGGSRGRLISYSTCPCRALVLCTIYGAEAEPEPSHQQRVY